MRSGMRCAKAKSAAWATTAAVMRREVGASPAKAPSVQPRKRSSSLTAGRSAISSHDSHQGFFSSSDTSRAERSRASADRPVPRAERSTAAPSRNRAAPIRPAPPRQAAVRHQTGWPNCGDAGGQVHASVRRRSTRCHHSVAPRGISTAISWCRGMASSRFLGASPCRYHSPASPMTIGIIPCPTEGIALGAGRVSGLVALSGPRKRISSSVRMAAVPRSSSHVSTAEERSVRARGRRMAGLATLAGLAATNCSGPASAAVSALRATITCPAKGTSARRPSLRMPGRSAAPASALTSRITGVSVFCASLPLLEAVVTARQVAAASAARPINASTVTTPPPATLDNPRAIPAGSKWSATPAVRAIDRQLAASVASVTANTARNLPNTISCAPQGAMSSVSMVPRSFSPAIASIAG